MKKYVSMVIIIVISLLFLTSCGKKEEYNAPVQTWLAENIQNQDGFQFKASSKSSYQKEITNSDEANMLTYSVTKNYVVSVNKPEKTVKIELISDSISTHLSSDGRQVSYETTNRPVENEVMYIQVEDGGVSINNSIKNGLNTEYNYPGADIAEAFIPILFPDDASIYEGKVTAPTGGASDHERVERAVPAEVFYRPFYLAAGTEMGEIGTIALKFDLNTQSGEVDKIYMPPRSLHTFYSLLFGLEYPLTYNDANLHTKEIYFTDFKALDS